eukprot:233755-Amphidinium_carterae.1
MGWSLEVIQSRWRTMRSSAQLAKQQRVCLRRLDGKQNNMTCWSYNLPPMDYVFASVLCVSHMQDMLPASDVWARVAELEVALSQQQQAHLMIAFGRRRYVVLSCFPGHLELGSALRRLRARFVLDFRP